MSLRQIYIGVENIALTAPQRQTLIDALKLLGPSNDPSPARRNHWRIRLDLEAAIYEANFDDSFFTITALRQRLADLFGVPLAQVTNTTTNPSAGTVLTLRYNAQDKVRFVLFGGSSATYDESHAAALAYLSANQAAWEPTVV